MARILCVDDENAALQMMEMALQDGGHITVGVRNAEAALTVLDRGGVDLVISDYRMPGTSGLSLLRRLREQGNSIPVILVTGHASIEHAVTAMKEGAVDYITKPLQADALRLAVEGALHVVRLERENAHLREEVSKLRSTARIIGESTSLRQILSTIEVVAPTRSTVLLEGESGTGKELLARAVHDQSDRRDGPFISINCAAMPENLVESTLFGHEKGSFTGAHKRVEGAFERADGGTLLLDEVTEMRLETQAKLLRVLQEQEFERVGGTRTLKVDVRIVATTNRDMAELVQERVFREDLFYRLTVVPLKVPPLRDRQGDLPLLVQYFAQRTAQDLGRPMPRVSSEALEFLAEHPWPGNIRELSHAVERAVILNQGLTLSVASFKRTGLGGGATWGNGGGIVIGEEGPLEDPTIPDGVTLRLGSYLVSEAEQELIALALAACNQNKTHAAELLGMNVRTLRKKLNTPSDTPS